MGKVWRSVMRLWYGCRRTSWLKFFAVNGEREWRDIRFTGFREMHDDVALCGSWAGVTTSREYFQVSARIGSDLLIPRRDYRESLTNLCRETEKQLRTQIDSFLRPECRCRLGFHWKCSIHKTWEN